jgi:hypothetical protein
MVLNKKQLYWRHLVIVLKRETAVLASACDGSKQEQLYWHELVMILNKKQLYWRHLVMVLKRETAVLASACDGSKQEQL